MPASDNPKQTRLQDLYRYVGDDTMAKLPSLKSGARTWIGILQHNPSLQSIQTKEDLAKWVSTHPNTGVSTEDFSNYEKLLDYQRAFPNGLPSEDLQRRLQTEIKNDQAQSPNPITHTPTGHNTLDQFTSLFDPKGIEHDRNFRRILKNVVNNHNRINPNNPFTQNLVVWKNRQRVLNPDLPPELLAQARALFGEAVGEKRLEYLDNQETKRIYNRQANDPAIRRMEQLIKQELVTKIKTLEETSGTVSQAEIQTLEKQIRETHTAQFVRDYPEKAEVYARGNKDFKEVLKEDRELQKQLRAIEKSQTKQKNKVYRINPQNDPEVKSLKAGNMTPEEFVKKYPKKAKAYRRRIKEIGTARALLLKQEKEAKNKIKSEEKQIRKLKRHTDPTTDLELQKIKSKYPNRLSDSNQKAAFERDMNEFVRDNKRARSAMYQQDADVKSAFGRIKNAQAYLNRPGRFSRIFENIPVPLPTTQSDEQQENEVPRQTKQSEGPTEQKNRFQRARLWLKNQYEKRKKQAREAAQKYFSKEFRQISAQYAKQAARYAGSFARSSLGPGIRNASRAIPKLGALPRAGLGAGRLGGIPIRPPVPPAAGLVANPWFWVVVIIIIIILLILLWFLHNDLNSGDVNVSVEKTGPSAVPNPPEDGSDIEYTIRVTWSGGPSSITVTDYIPENTEFVSATGDYKLNGATGSAQTVVWNIKGSGGGGAVSGDVASLLPNPVPPDPSNAADARQNVLSHYEANPELIQFYKEASAESGLPWQVYAGLHWREADATPGYSLTSGREYGTYEPDVTVCNGPPGVVDGLAEPGCVFTDAVDDILYVTDHLIGKIGKMPSTHEELSEALARYNGYPGRSNCHHGTPYPHCPPDFPGEDNSYVFTYFDEKHATMYEIYCADGTLCGDNRLSVRPGGMTVIKWVAESIQ